MLTGQKGGVLAGLQAPSARVLLTIGSRKHAGSCDSGGEPERQDVSSSFQ